MVPSKVFILTGAIQSGKTTALKAWIDKKELVAGFLSPVIDGKRMFLDIETMNLIPMESDRKDLEVGRYVFDAISFDRMERNVKKAWQQAKADFIVIDEIGPLEINKDQGFHELLCDLQGTLQDNRPNLLMVIRESCVEPFLSKYTFKDVKVLTLVEFKDGEAF